MDGSSIPDLLALFNNSLINAVDKARTGYTDEILVQSLASLGIHAKSVFKHTNFFLSLNRIGGVNNLKHVEDVVKLTKDSGVGIAWPDTIGQINDNEFNRIPVWGVAKKYRHEVPIFAGGDTSGTEVPSSSAENAVFVRKVFDLVTGSEKYCAAGNRCTDGFRSPYFYWIKTVTGRKYPSPVTTYFTEAVKLLNTKNASNIINQDCPSKIAPCRSAADMRN